MNTTSRRYLIAVLLLSVLLRVGVALYLGDTVPPAKDEQSYSLLAARLATGHGYSFEQPWYPFAPANAPTAHWSFLYTAFVAAIYAIAGPHPLAARLVQAVLAGLLLPWLTYRLVQRMQGTGDGGQGIGGRGQGAAHSTFHIPHPPFHIPHPPFPIPHSTFDIPLLAAFLSAIYAYFVLYSAMVQTEAFYICALLWSLERALALASSIGHSPFPIPHSIFHIALTLGLTLGIATLLRQSILPWAAVLFAWLLWQILRGSEAPKLRRSAFISGICVPVLILLACIVPFTIRNYRVYGDFLLLNSNAGYAMYSAQHPMHGASFQEYTAAPLPEDLLSQGLNEAQWDKALMRRGIGFVLAEPGRYLLLCLSRVRDYFEFWPTADSSLLFNLGRVASFGIFLPFMLYGVWLAVRRQKASGEREQESRGRGPGSEDLAPRTSHLLHSTFDIRHSTFLLLFVLFYSALHIATWAMSRYRLPVDAVLLIFAAAGIADLTARTAARRRL